MTSNEKIRANGLSQLIYVSRSLTGAESGLQMSGILAQARPANARDGITGVLTAVEGRFVQIVEGPDDALDGLMVRLVRDSRHTDLIVRERRGIISRAFYDWDMVSPRLAPQELATLSLLIGMPDAGLGDFIPILAAAVAYQEAVLEGRTQRPRLDNIAVGRAKWSTADEREA